MVSTLSSRPSVIGFDSRMGCRNVVWYAGTSKVKHEIILSLLQNLALQLGLGQQCQSEGIAIT